MCIAKVINTTSGDQPAGEMNDDFLELANGCLCCSIKDTGIAAIEKLMRRKGGFDYILLETTGLADPGSVFFLDWRELSDNSTKVRLRPFSGKMRNLLWAQDKTSIWTVSSVL